MAHELDFSTGNAAIAITADGQIPWHGHFNRVPDGADLDQWRIAAGLNWDVLEAPVMYSAEDEGADYNPFGRASELKTNSSRKVLYRSDNREMLEVVSDRYKVVQPREVLEFYGDLINDFGFEMETAGALREGRRIWALAKTGHNTRIMGQDEVRGYLLLATSYDGSLATVAKNTSVRVVCNNTLEFSMADGSEAVKVAHSRSFDDKYLRAQLGLEKEAWQAFEEGAHKLAAKSVSLSDAADFFVALLGDRAVVKDEATGKVQYSKHFKQYMNCYEHGKGQDTRSARHTAWGLVNAVTLYRDHESRAHSPSTRLNAAWFGNGAAEKRKAWSMALAAA